MVFYVICMLNTGCPREKETEILIKNSWTQLTDLWEPYIYSIYSSDLS